MLRIVLTGCVLVAMATLALWRPSSSGIGVEPLSAPPPGARQDDTPAAEPKDPVERLAAKIDELLAKRWNEAGVFAAPEAGDAEFVRRVYLDIIGRIPHVSEVRAFLADDSPDKRRKLVDKLLDKSPGYVAHWTNVWTAAYLPEVESNFQFRYLAPSFESWVRKQLLEGKTYDEWVSQLLTTTNTNNRNQLAIVYGQQAGDPTPLAFYQAKQNKPEELAAAAARLFMGIRIECAQCHRHPFAKWEREDFWGLAAFFKGSNQRRRGGVEGVLADLFTFPEITIPDTDKVVQAKFIDGSEPRFKGNVPFRQTLADWITSPNNPYFAKATANRIWAEFFGTGIVDPVDDFDEKNNPASHPELLEELAHAFTEQEYDLKFLMRAITSSNAYQLTSRQTHKSQNDPQLFARAAVRGLTGLQLYDSIATATGYKDPSGNRNPFVFGVNTPRGEFVEKFKAGTQSPTERQTSIIQALTLMNGQLVQSATDLRNSELLTATLEYPLFSNADRIETLFLATLSRPPREDELDKFVEYVEDGGPKKDSKAALADVFWALLNSSEFVLNH